VGLSRLYKTGGCATVALPRVGAGLNLRPPIPQGSAVRRSGSVGDVYRRDRLDGLIHEYFAEDEVGRSAEERFRHALQQGEAVEIDAGVTLEFERLPPGL
jgi:hypothetical protein